MQLFVGNFDYEAQSRDIERLLDRYGDVERVDMKMGACLTLLGQVPAGTAGCPGFPTITATSWAPINWTTPASS